MRSLSGSPVAHGRTQCWNSLHLTLSPMAYRALGALFTFPWKISYKHIKNLFLKDT